MTTALSASLLADMTEQDKIGLAKQLSMTSAAALDDANLEAALRASRQEALRSEMAAIEQKEVAIVLCRSLESRSRQQGSDDEDVVINEAETKASAARKMERKRKRMRWQASSRALNELAPTGSPQARAAEAAIARKEKRDFERLTSQQRMRMPRSTYMQVYGRGL